MFLLRRWRASDEFTPDDSLRALLKMVIQLELYEDRFEPAFLNERQVYFGEVA